MSRWPARSFMHLSMQQLALIFSYLTCPDLLRAEQVCRRWRKVIDVHHWRTLRHIKEETIGYPEDANYLINFIRLARHVHEVKEMINIFELVDRSRPLDHDLYAKLKRAMLELIRKRTPDAVFPLDVISNLVITECIEQNKTIVFQAYDVHTAILDVLTRFHVREFNALRVRTYLLDAYKPAMDSFVVAWNNGQMAMPIRLNKITSLVIGCLNVRMAWIGMDVKVVEAHFANQLQRLAALPCLQRVTVESILLLLPHCVEGGKPPISLKVSFRPLRCQFTVAQFGQFLMKIMKYSDESRINYLAECVKVWVEEKSKVKEVELKIRNNKFDVIESLSLNDVSQMSSREVMDDPIKLLIGQIYPRAIGSLHLTIETDCFKENRFFSLLGKCVLSRLKNLSVVFSHDVQMREMEVCDDVRRAYKARAIFRALADRAKKAVNLERLTLDFRVGGVKCMSVMLEPMDGVKGPLPKLRTLECYGLPCTPFVVTLVSQSPNLRHLVVECHSFQSYDSDVHGIQKLLAALQGCRNLLTVSIKAVEVNQETGFSQVSFRPKRKHCDDDEYSNLWTSLEEKFDQLVATVVSLVRAEVVIGDEFIMKMDKYSKTTLKTEKG